MKNQTPSSPELRVPPLAQALRTIAVGLRTGKTVEDFFACAGQALSRIPGVGKVVLHRGNAEIEFPSNAVIAPILGKGSILGTLEVSDDSGTGFGRDEFQIVSALADAISAMLSQFLAANRQSALAGLLPDEHVFEELLSYDVKRCATENRMLALAVLRGPEGSADALYLVQSLLPILPPAARLGPIGSGSAAVAVAGMGVAELLSILRDEYRARPISGLHLGLARLRSQNETAGHLIDAARTRLVDIEQVLQADPGVDSGPPVSEDLVLATIEHS